MRHASGPKPPHGAGEQPEPLATLLARAEQKLKPDADARDGAACGHSLSQGVIESVPREPGRGALDVPHAGDQRERRLAYEPRHRS